MAAYHPAWYGMLAHGQEVRRIDLKDPAGRAALHELLTDADLFLTSSRPSALARLGLDWPGLSAKYPRLAQVAITGYPAPDLERSGHDLTYLASEVAGATRDAAHADCGPGRRRARRGGSAGVALSRERSGTAGYMEVSLEASGARSRGAIAWAS
jgi:crotonobetainyl-CoA:carnitine CoA-transferase CaiB-like acyl-CoA transferase